MNARVRLFAGAILAAALSALVATGVAEADGRHAARIAAPFLTVPEAKAQARQFVVAVDRDLGNDIRLLRVGNCKRGSPSRVACHFYEEYVKDTGGRFYCGGKVRVVKTSRFYRRRAYSIDCGAA